MDPSSTLPNYRTTGTHDASLDDANGYPSNGNFLRQDSFDSIQSFISEGTPHPSSSSSSSTSHPHTTNAPPTNTNPSSVTGTVYSTHTTNNSITPLHVVDALADMEHELRTAKATLALAENNKVMAETKALVLEKALIDALRHISGMDKVIEHGILPKTTTTRALRLPLEHLHDKNKEAINTLTHAIGEAMGAVVPSASSSYPYNDPLNDTMDTDNRTDSYSTINDTNNNSSTNNNNNDWDTTATTTSTHPTNPSITPTNYVNDHNAPTQGLGMEDITHPPHNASHNPNNGTNAADTSTNNPNGSNNDNGTETNESLPSNNNNPSNGNPNIHSTENNQALKQVRKTYQKLLFQTCSATSNRLHPLINPDTLAKVFTYLDGNELGKVTQVCRSWHSLPLRSDCRLWRMLTRQGILPKTLRSSVWQNILYSSTDMVPGEEVTWDRELVSLLFGWVGPEAAAGPKRPLRHRTIAKLLNLRPGWRQTVQRLEKLDNEKNKEENDDGSVHKDTENTSSNDTNEGTTDAVTVDNDDDTVDTSSYPLTLRTTKPRHIIDHTLRLNLLPRPIALRIPIEEKPDNDERKAHTVPTDETAQSSASSSTASTATSTGPDSTPSATSATSSPPSTSASATLPAQLIFEHYLRAGIANQKANEAVRSCKEATNMVRRLRGEKARLTAELERAVEEGKGFPAALSHEYTERDAELTIAETNVRTLAQQARELIQLAHTALNTADDYFLNALLEARRKWIQAIIRGWIIQQRRGLPTGPLQPLLLHNYTLPVSGCTVPTLGIKLPIANVSKQSTVTIGGSGNSGNNSANINSSSVPALVSNPSTVPVPSVSTTASLSAAASPATQSLTGSYSTSNIPTLNLSNAPPVTVTASSATTTNTAVPPLPSTSTQPPVGSPPSYVPSSANFFQLSPFFPLPLRLQRLLHTKISEDFDVLQEETLGLKYVNVPLPPSANDGNINASHIPLRAYSSTPNDGAQAHPIMFELGSPRRTASKHPSKNPTPNPSSDAGFVPTTNNDGSAGTVNPTADASTTPSTVTTVPQSSTGSETNGAAALPQDSHDVIYLPAPPFTSQHLLIDADVRRTFGDLDKALNMSTTVSSSADNGTNDTPSSSSSTSSSASPSVQSCKLTDLFPTAYISPSTPNVFTRTSLNALRSSLKDILLAYTAFDHGAVGYCQGMNFLVATFLRHDTTPHTAFWGLAALVNSPLYAFRDMFSSGLYKVGLSFYTLKELLHRHNPRLEIHLRNLGIRPDMYVAGWVMCLFASMETLPLPQVAALWDSFLLNGWKSLWRVILTLLDGVSTECVEATDMAAIVTLLHQYPKERLPPSPSALLRRAYRIKVTTSILKEITIRYDRFKCPWRYLSNKQKGKVLNGHQSRVHLSQTTTTVNGNGGTTTNPSNKNRTYGTVNPAMNGAMTIHNPNSRSRSYSEALSGSQNNSSSSSDHDDIAWASGHSGPIPDENMQEDNEDDNEDDDAYYSDDNNDDDDDTNNEGGALGADSMLAALWAAGGMRNASSKSTNRRRNKQSSNNTGGLMQWMFWRKPTGNDNSTNTNGSTTTTNTSGSQPLASMVNRSTVNTSFVGSGTNANSNTAANWFGNEYSSNNNTTVSVPNTAANHAMTDTNDDKDPNIGVRNSRASSLVISTRSSGRGMDDLMNNNNAVTRSRRSSLTNNAENNGIVPSELDFALENIGNDATNDTNGGGRRSRFSSVASVRSIGGNIHQPNGNGTGPIMIPNMNLIPPASVMKTSLSDFTNMTANSPLSQVSSFPTFSIEENDSTNSEPNTPYVTDSTIANGKDHTDGKTNGNSSSTSTPVRVPFPSHKGVAATPDVLAAFSTADDAAFDSTGSPFFPGHHGGHHHPSSLSVPPSSSHGTTKSVLQNGVPHPLAHTLSMNDSLTVTGKLHEGRMYHPSLSTSSSVPTTSSPLVPSVVHSNKSPLHSLASTASNSPSQIYPSTTTMNTTTSTTTASSTTNNGEPASSWEPFKDGTHRDSSSLSPEKNNGDHGSMNGPGFHREKNTHTVLSWGGDTNEITAALFPPSSSVISESAVPTASFTDHSTTNTETSMVIHNEGNTEFSTNDLGLNQGDKDNEHGNMNDEIPTGTKNQGNEGDDEHIEWPEPELTHDSTKGNTTTTKAISGGGLLTSGLQVMKSRFSRILGANDEENSSNGNATTNE